MHRSEQNSSQKTDNKEPWLAVNLSRLLPGIGQVYAGKPFKGYIILLSYFLLAGIGGWFLLKANVLVGIVMLMIALLFLPIWNLFDAHYSARSRNSREFESARKQSKDAWLAIFLSGFIPGLGHIYLRQWLPGILFLTAFITIVIIAAGLKSPVIVLFANLLQVVLVLIAFYHVYVSAPVRRERSRQTVLLFITGFMSISVILSVIPSARQFVETRWIPSGSMQPTLQVNDRLLIDKLSYRFGLPQRGDIVVFAPTDRLKAQGFKDSFICRVIGLPGEQVEVNGGRVYINGQVLQESYIEEAPNYQWGPVKVPDNQYLVLGDNRNNSYDSHYWGFVPRENIIGKATQRFYPFDRAGSLAGK